jgi:hypothetical protein
MFLVYGGILVAAELICRILLPHPAFYAGDPGYVSGLYVMHPGAQRPPDGRFRPEAC